VWWGQHIQENRIEAVLRHTLFDLVAGWGGNHGGLGASGYVVGYLGHQKPIYYVGKQIIEEKKV
jgi:hypothetical protein